MLIADCWLYILIAISVKGKSVIWKSPEVWARGRLCAQSPRSRRGKQLAAWGLGPCSARKGETAEGPWSHQLSSHTPEFFIFFLFLLLFFSFYFDPITCLPIHLHCTILEGALQLFKMPLASNIDEKKKVTKKIKYWHPWGRKTRKFEAKSAQSKIMFSMLFTRRQNWNEYGSKRWTLESTWSTSFRKLVLHVDCQCFWLNKDDLYLCVAGPHD